ncbi:hypothetical protein PM082_012334 [Marasmius tenuissimus]|nr:hypothetical protein PM082_012334 [Marasmius tenuissimus]
MQGALRSSLPRLHQSSLNPTRNMITLYDVGPTSFGKEMGMSPFARSLRFALNYKKIPYTVTEISLLDIEPTAKSIGVAPTPSFIANGAVKYTVPFIHDASNPKPISLSDSFTIAEYLDTAYPDTPRVIPPGTRMLQKTFSDTFTSIHAPMVPLILPTTVERVMPPKVQERLRAVKGDKAVRCALTEEEREKIWETVVGGMRELAEGYSREEDSAFVMGGTSPTWADMLATGLLWWVREVFGDTKGWKDIAALGDGRIGRLVDDTVQVCKPSPS